MVCEFIDETPAVLLDVAREFGSATTRVGEFADDVGTTLQTLNPQLLTVGRWLLFNPI